MAETEDINVQLVETLKTLGEILQDELKASLIQQGHQATDELIRSIEMRVTTITNGVVLDGMFLFYGRNVDTGRKAGTKRVPLDALIEWVQNKGLERDAKKARGVAFQVQRAIFEKGISTPQSWKGETTKNWMTNVIDRNEQLIADEIEAACESVLSVTISNIITAASSRFSASPE